MCVRSECVVEQVRESGRKVMVNASEAEEKVINKSYLAVNVQYRLRCVS